jgi:hypothetical protein
MVSRESVNEVFLPDKEIVWSISVSSGGQMR